jgi:hypothetical protein
MTLQSRAIDNVESVLKLAGISVVAVSDAVVKDFNVETKVGGKTYSAGKYVSAKVKVLVPAHDPLQ